MYYWKICIWPSNLLVWWWQGSDHLKNMKDLNGENKIQRLLQSVVMRKNKLMSIFLPNDFWDLPVEIIIIQLLILSKTWTSALESIRVVNDSTTRRSQLKKVTLLCITAYILTKQYFDNINEYSSLLIDSLTGDLFTSYVFIMCSNFGTRTAIFFFTSR